MERSLSESDKQLAAVHFSEMFKIMQHLIVPIPCNALGRKYMLNWCFVQSILVDQFSSSRFVNICDYLIFDVLLFIFAPLLLNLWYKIQFLQNFVLCIWTFREITCFESACSPRNASFGLEFSQSKGFGLY